MPKRLRPILIAICCAGALPARGAAELAEHQHALEVAGRKLTCGHVKTELDRDLPNLGVAYPDDRVLVLNPRLLRRYSDTVQLFVYHHECGHHHVGGNELGADCWAVEQGLRSGWLDRQKLPEICNSFGGAPETSTHPSAKRRCAALDKCFGTVTAKIAAEREQQVAAVKKTAPQSSPPVIMARAAAKLPPPKLLSGPVFAWQGTVKDH
ncbi:MAG: hypothetical protein JSS20_01500 [Proteobacteria bacterium]|nr:hypothetical protein [Pseudomonadota bacterium]